MIYGMYLSTMGAMVQTQRHATISNNLANTNTTGFKPDWSIFTEVPVENEFHPERQFLWDKILMKSGGGVWNDTTITNLKPGPMQFTGNVFDVALHDEPNSNTSSFFMVRPENAQEGDVYFTRDGHFIPDDNGVLRTTGGDLVLGPDGDPITVPLEQYANVTINKEGMILNVTPEGTEELGQLGVFRTPEFYNMVKVGDNRFYSDEATMENWQNGVQGGYLEMSATSAITEMTNMIEASRIYETNMKFLTIQDDTLGDTIRRVGTWTGN